MAQDASVDEALEIVCPHCKKTFTGRLMDGAAERYRGFKCPHCKLFVPAARTDAELRDASGPGLSQSKAD